MLFNAMGREAEAIYASFVFSNSGARSGSDTERVSPEFDYIILIAKIGDHLVTKHAF